MARTTPRKKSESTSGHGNILSFFKKDTTSDPSSQRRKLPDVKPEIEDVGSSGRRPREESRVMDRKGKSKATESTPGSAIDPVVISDDDDEPSLSKRQRVEDEPRNEDAAGPSRPPARRSCTSPSQIVGSASPPKASSVELDHIGSSRATPIVKPPEPTLIAPPDPFPNIPGFKPPSIWPDIVNTGVQPDEDARTENHDDADGSQRGMNDDIEEEDFVEELPGFEDSANIRVNHLQEPPPPNTAPLDNFSDFGMDWHEPEDEGMGMDEDEDGDDGFSEIVETPPMRSRHLPKGKVTSCPICSTSLKGKSQAVIETHINTCLDSTSKGPRIRPITSINHMFSPAPSSPSPPPEEVARGPNAFSVLMSGHKEKEEWKDAEVDLKRDGKRFFGRRKAPFYKVLTGMPVAVDAFRYGAVPKVTAYLLTHAHSDHYTNLSKSWKEGPIYCSETTANLIIHMLGVEPQWVHGLPNDIPFVMPNTGGVTVTPIEANHCPGSSIFLFEGPQTVNAGDSTIKSPYVGSKRIFRYLHCGDFRACPKMVLHPAIARARIDTCYLDTTYLNPRYCFPPQPQVIEACAMLARKEVLGLSAKALPVDQIKPGIRDENMVKFDIKPDINAIQAENDEKSKAMMAGWLVKRESEDDVKQEYEVKEELDVKPTLDDVEMDQDEERGIKDEQDVKPKEEQLVSVKREKPPARTLVIMGTYSIGKERIVKAVARALGTTIYCDPRKKGLLLCQTDPDLHAMLSSDPIESQVHLVPLSNIQLDRLQPYLARLYPHFDRVLGFRPTGWAYTPPAGTDMLPDVNQVIRRDQSRSFSEASLKPQRGSCKQFMMYGVPYSEHSSFFELTCFALSMPGPNLKMIATVNVHNEKSRAKMKKWFEKWAVEKARRKEKNLPPIVDYRDENYW
ncbi:DNA repair metallo-beta-lactamase-domain-containing protein [Kockovaella imperatae]|uniref:DNA repair metallo-beta-lactamase-domain-containing protein n=1 Tax=Kockovaella imperatae TaxID=4999 RepID=A0A1Y1UHY0_9TREE|nr:DNA repair metallo-beta-lactamase-domain-containing protein [Kockovaella imperatae]ORX37648.1 DNA repair metallo-beta-lactamase-domain-containing protein [Kockovaella imperatae]